MIESLEELIYMTAWPMTEPRAYGPFHISFTLIGFALCAFAAWKLRGVGEKGNRAVLLSAGIFLAVCEVYKQLFYYFCIGDPGCDWDIFPFQLCSVPMYLCIIAPMLKKGRVQSAMYSFMGFFNLLGGAISFFEPSGLLHSWWTLTLHALLWHMSLVFIGLYLLFSGRAGREWKDYKNAALVFLGLCALAFSINLMLRGVSGGDVNMFFLGPSNNPIIVFSDIAEYAGWFAATAVYIPAVCFGAYLVFMAQRLIAGIKQKCLQ